MGLILRLDSMTIIKEEENFTHVQISGVIPSWSIRKADANSNSIVSSTGEKSGRIEKMNNLKTIIFDAGGVLIYISKTRKDILATTLKAMGYDDSIINKAIDAGKAFDKEYFSSCEDVIMWSDEKKWLKGRYQLIADVVNCEDSVLADKLYMLTFDTHVYKLYPEVIDVLEELRKHYRLSIISNALPSLDWSFDSLGIRGYFDEIIISAYEGVSKPNKTIYEVALERLDVKADECMFIDDRLENVEAAKELGMVGYYLDRSVKNLISVREELLQVR